MHLMTGMSLCSKACQDNVLQWSRMSITFHLCIKWQSKHVYGFCSMWVHLWPMKCFIPEALLAFRAQYDFSLVCDLSYWQIIFIIESFLTVNALIMFSSSESSLMLSEIGFLHEDFLTFGASLRCWLESLWLLVRGFLTDIVGLISDCSITMTVVGV